MKPRAPGVLDAAEVLLKDALDSLRGRRRMQELSAAVFLFLFKLPVKGLENLTSALAAC